ncbi:hypothetical protein H0H93_001940 [Arthromyces matolae]|nr:hypothetical protein H0H93_001940 [Arthromyces matolae]
MSASNGRPEPEVIMNARKMEEAFRAGGLLEKPPTKATKDPATSTLKRDDVDLIVRAFLARSVFHRNVTYSLFKVNEFEIARPQAEKALLENGGDVTKTLISLVTP